MENTSKNRQLTDREIFYFRQRHRNRVFQSVAAFFAQEAQRQGLTKSDIAQALGKDRSQITRWFAGPGNWELDTISDLLLAMGAEMDHEIVPLDAPSNPPISDWSPIKGTRVESLSGTKHKTALVA